MLSPLDKILSIFKPPKEDFKVPEFERLLIQFYTWRKYMKWVKDNDIPIDEAEWVLIHNTYKVLRQEIKLRLGIMRRMVEENFSDMVIRPLLEQVERRRKEMLDASNNQEESN
jgi:hypothetical protein